MEYVDNEKECYLGEFYGHIGHLYGITSPYANAGGPVKTLEQVAAMAATSVGWIEAGSFTLEPRPDLSLQGQTTYIKGKYGETFNKFEMPNQGKDGLLVELPDMLDVAHGHGKPLVVTVSPTGEDAAVETTELVRELYLNDADAVLVSPDCPSLRDADGNLRDRISKDPKRLREFLGKIRDDLGIFRSIFLRIAPADTRADMKIITDVVKQSGIVSALFVTNSMDITEADINNNPELKDWNGAGGKSGPAMAFRSANLTRWAVEDLRGSGIDVVRSCGVAVEREVERSLDIGAVAAAGSTFFFESRNWLEDVDRLLSNLASGNS